MILSSRAFKLILFFLVFSYSSPLSAQVEGCTDPYALNYDPEATWNDGSCFYEETYYSPEVFVELPAILDETSGIIFWDDHVWTFNDSGGDPRIYKVDTAGGNVVQEITISNGINVDWEDIDQDADHIYVGDFGNNNGNRKDLLIYKIAKADIPTAGNADVTAEIITFNYADQEDFTSNPNNNEYDCEAMICVEGNIYLFTKNWVSETSRLYSMPVQPGNYSLMPLDTLLANGLVTGASYSGELEQVVLSGYKNYIPFLFLLFDYHDHIFFSGNKRQILMPGIFGNQTEGICFVQGYDGFLSSENSIASQRLFSFSTAEWTDTSTVSIEENMNRFEVYVHPNPVTDGHFTLQFPDPVLDTYQIKIYSSSGKVVFSKNIGAHSSVVDKSIIIDLPDISPGMYLVHIVSGKMYARESIIVQ
jgi:hypothetical protein